MKHKIILSTRNPGKTEQIKLLLNNPDIQLLTLSDAGIIGEAVEDGATLEENAEKKALFAFEHADGASWTMADDSGIFIRALGGEPGVQTALWTGAHDDAETVMRHCLEKMRGITNRQATFKAVAVLISPYGKKYVFTGAVNGWLLTEAKTPPPNGMPFMPLFVPSGGTRPWSEMTTEEVNVTSHRGQAFRKVAKFLNRLE